MICYGLATRFGKNSFTWHIPYNGVSSFFAKQLADKIKNEVTDFCNSQLQPRKVSLYQKDGYYFSLLKMEDNCCIVATDCELNSRQMAYLHMYLIEIKIPMEIIASDLDKYTQDVKINELKVRIEETKTTVLKNLEQLLERQDKLAELLEASDKLAKDADEYNRGAKALNSCWPACSIL